MPLPIRPIVKHPVRELLIEAGHNVSAYSMVFLGRDGEPIVACIWFEGLTLSDEEVFYEGNERAYRQGHHAFKKLAYGPGSIGS